MYYNGGNSYSASKNLADRTSFPRFLLKLWVSSNQLLLEPVEVDWFLDDTGNSALSDVHLHVSRYTHNRNSRLFHLFQKSFDFKSCFSAKLLWHEVISDHETDILVMLFE